MKFSNKISVIFVALALVLPMLLGGCNQSKDLLYYEYDYDLSEYITLGEYKGIPLTSTEIEVTDEEVQIQIQSMLAQHGDSKNITDRPLAAGDVVIYRCHAFLDGEEVPELYEESGTFMLGNANYGEEADSVLIGSVPGDTVYAKRTLNDFYGEYAGKTVDYEFYILGGYNITMPQYTDAFVKAYLGYENIAALEEGVYKQLYNFRKENMENHLVSTAWHTVVENTTVIDYPEAELNELANYYVDEIKATASAAGVTYEGYLNAVFGQTPEEFEESQREEAKATIKDDMIVYAIARAENLTVSDEKYEEYLNRFITEYEEFMYTYEVENTFGEELLKAQVLREVVKEYVAEVADITK